MGLTAGQNHLHSHRWVQAEEARCCEEIWAPLASKIHWLQSYTTPPLSTVTAVPATWLQVSALIRMYCPVTPVILLVAATSWIESLLKRQGSLEQLFLLDIVRCTQQDVGLYMRYPVHEISSCKKEISLLSRDGNSALTVRSIAKFCVMEKSQINHK